MQPHIESVVKAENQDVPHGTVQACDRRAQTRGQKDKSLCQREAHGCESLARLPPTDSPVGRNTILLPLTLDLWDKGSRGFEHQILLLWILSAVATVPGSFDAGSRVSQVYTGMGATCHCVPVEITGQLGEIASLCALLVLTQGSVQSLAGLDQAPSSMLIKVVRFAW